MITKLIIKLLPYALCVFGFLFTLGGIASLTDSGAKPEEMDISTLEKTQRVDLPAWINVRGAEKPHFTVFSEVC
jgi:hypothetical protein